MNYLNLQTLAETLEEISKQTGETYYIDFQHNDEEIRVNKTCRFLKKELDIVKPFFQKLVDGGIITSFKKASEPREYRVWVSTK